jgi:pimeloyl-ACP methyl ester carboxylesterase
MADLKSILRFSRVPANGIHLNVAEAGPPDGPLVVLLHGFPEFWYSWRNQIGPLSARGFHVVAPDLRGYNLSDKPIGADNYTLDQLAADVVHLADAFTKDAFTVVGHDWGAAIGWWLAGRYPKRMRRLVALNASHPAIWVDAMRNDPAQKRKSSYVRFFQMPYLPEFLIRLSGSKGLAKPFRDCVRPDAFTEADIREYQKAWSQPGTLTATINYYRAILRHPPSSPAEYHIACPTLVIWGKRDAYGLPHLAEASLRLCADGRIVYFDHATHWVQHDEPERVSELLLEAIA